MARIPADELARLKSEISLLRLVESQGYEITRQGKDYAISCPFHEEKTPSCLISPKTNLFHCFGCGAAGSVIDWVMKTQGVSFRHAVELLRRGDPASLAADTAVKKTTVPKLEAPVSEDADDQTLLHQVIDYYHHTLKESPEALAYLDKRGLDDAELIDHFKLGHANRTLGLRLPYKNRKAGSQIREQLQRIGVYRDTGREHFNGSLVIPVINDGVITEVYGRKLLDNLRKGTPKHTYLPGPHRGVFNLEGLQHTEEVILCESLIDALTFWRWGFRHVTASFGTNGFTDELLQAFVTHKIQRVLIAYDRDEAGNKAAEAVTAQLNQHGIDCFRILFPKGMDANAYAREVTPAAKSLGLVIRSAQWLGNADAPRRQQETGNRQQEENPEAKAKERFETQLKTLATQVNDLGQRASDTEAIAESAPATPTTDVIDQAATPVPKLPAADVEIAGDARELFISLGGRTYRVRGLDKNSDGDQLRIQLLAKRDDQFHMDKLDLYSSKQRQVFINQACVELGVKEDVIKKDLGKVLLTLEEQQAKQQEAAAEKQPTALEPQERRAAFELLHDPALLNRILADFNNVGVVGEETNKLVGYLACVSRKLDKPLAVLIQSSSAAGKSSLMDAILALMPEEERVQYSAMTGQSLFYMGETNLKNKILAISEEEGVHNASYALKLLQSEGEVTIASTGKDDSTGNLVTKEYTVQGPVMLFMTTTAIDIDEELLNRCVVLSVNESREQTQAIHAAQRARRTLQGLQAQLERERLIALHRNAQRLLKPLHVINPYADRLTFLDDKTRTRRDHEKYLTLIDSIALLHQYQRDIKALQHDGEVIEYVEVTLDDITKANQLAHEILGRTLDELPPQTRKLLKEIQALVQRECQSQGIEQRDFRFSRKTVREWTGWGNTQLKVHLKRLEDMEYLLVHRGGRGQTFEYELLYDAPNDSDNHLMGLIDIDHLQNYNYDKKKSGVNEKKSGSSRPQVGGKSGSLKWRKPTAVVVCSESGSVLRKSALEAV